MDTLRSSKRDLDGAVALDYYIKKGQLDLDASGVKRFFARNLKAISTRLPSRRNRERNYRKELKDLMSTLMENPPGNALSQVYEANRAKFPDSLFGHLVDITICDSLAMLANQTDFNALRHIRQEAEESIMKFNARFYQKMTEVYPEYGRRITEEFSGTEAIFSPTELRSRTQIFNDYLSAIKRSIAEKIPYVDGPGKCLRYAMQKAIGIEANLRDFQERSKERNVWADNTQPRNNKRIAYSYQVATEQPIRSSYECFNCGKPNHTSSQCPEPQIKCPYCNRSGHMLKYCFRKRDNQKGQTSRRSYGGWKQNAFTAAIIISMIFNILINKAGAIEKSTKWYQPKYLGDYMEETKKPECKKYYIPMVRYDNKLITFKGTIEWLHARQEDYLPCPCDSKTKGFVSQGTRCLSFANVDVRTNGRNELEFNHRIISNILIDGDSDRMAWALAANKTIGKIRTKHFPQLKELTKFITDMVLNNKSDLVEAEELENYALNNILESEEIIRENGRTINRVEEESTGPSESNIAESISSDETLRNLGTIYRGTIENTNINDNSKPAHSSSLGIIYQPPVPVIDGKPISPTDFQSRSPVPSAPFKNNAPSPSSISTMNHNVLSSPLETPKTAKGGRVHFPPSINSGGDSGDQTFLSAVDKTFNAMVHEKNNDHKESYEKFDPLIASTALRTKENPIEKRISEEREKAFQRNVDKIASLADKIDDTSKLLAFKKEVEEAIYNLNGLDTLTVFFCTIMAFFGVYLKKKGWKTVISSIMKRVRRTPEGGTVIDQDNESQKEWEKLTDDLKKSGKSEKSESTKSGATRTTMNKTYGNEILTGREGSVITLGPDDLAIDKLLEQRGYSFILKIISENNNSEMPIVILNIEKVFMKVYIDDGSEISLMSKRRWSQIGEPKLEESNMIAKNTHTEIPIIGKVELNIGIPNKESLKEIFFIVDDLHLDVLIGRSFLKKYKTYKHDYDHKCIYLGRNRISLWYGGNHEKLVLKTIDEKVIQPGNFQDFQL